MIRVQEEAFDVAAELAAVKAGGGDIGGIVVFVGSVRDFSDGRHVATMTLEHYSGMTEKALEEIEAEAHRRWSLAATLIVHRDDGLAAPIPAKLPESSGLTSVAGIEVTPTTRFGP